MNWDAIGAIAELLGAGAVLAATRSPARGRRVPRGVVVLLAAGLLACEPSDRRPGTWLSGDIVREPVSDWTFTADAREVYVETRTWYGVPHSVTTACATTGDTLYIPSVYVEGDESRVVYQSSDSGGGGGFGSGSGGSGPGSGGSGSGGFGSGSGGPFPPFPFVISHASLSTIDSSLVSSRGSQGRPGPTGPSHIDRRLAA